MLDTKWFMERLRGDGLVVRLHINTSGRETYTEAHAYSYWVDDMAYNGFEVVYTHHLDRHHGMRPLQWIALPADPNRWDELWLKAAEDWPRHWDARDDVVCTIGAQPKRANRIPPSHPVVLTHLARFQAATASAHPQDGMGWGISADIATRRLEGLVQQALRDWARLVG
jgi:hypothetical protein